LGTQKVEQVEINLGTEHVTKTARNDTAGGVFVFSRGYVWPPPQIQIQEQWATNPHQRQKQKQI